MLYWQKLVNEIENKDAIKNLSLNPAFEKKDTIRVKRKLHRYFLDDARTRYLTYREAGCLYYIYRGYSIKNTAMNLGLSPRTVEFYFKRIKIKFHCKNRTELFSLLVNYNFMAKIQDEDFTLNESNNI